MTVMTITVMTVSFRKPHFFMLPIYKYIYYIIIIYIYIIYNIHFMVSYKKPFLKTVITVIVITVIAKVCLLADEGLAQY